MHWDRHGRSAPQGVGGVLEARLLYETVISKRLDEVARQKGVRDNPEIRVGEESLDQIVLGLFCPDSVQ